MASTSAITAPHPNAHLTVRNGNLSLLLRRLPRELRLDIYDYATYVDKDIRPYQVVQRSNKFVWGDFETSVCENQYQRVRGQRQTTSREEPLVVTSLSRTCRAIHDELEAYPVFYRVNNFTFMSPIDLIQFLAAITPARRNMIRRVTIVDDKWYPVWLQPADKPKLYPANKKLMQCLVLLAQCGDLQQLNFVTHLTKNMEVYMTSSHQEWAIKQAKTVLHDMQSDQNDWPFLSHPSFRLVCEPGDRVNTQLQPLAGLIAQLQDLAALRAKQASDDEEHGNGIQNTITAFQLQDAIDAAHLDIPGEDRVNRNLLDSSAASISSRTRNKCQAVSEANHIGTTRRQKAKYDAEGLLVWEFQSIDNVRWNGSAIESEVNWWNPGSGPKTSWETLESILTPEGVEHLSSFYHHLVRKRHRLGPISRLSEAEQLPRPKDITTVTDGLLSPWMEENPRGWKSYIRAWKDLPVKFDQWLEKLKKLEKEAERVKGRAAKAKAQVKSKRDAKVTKATKVTKASKANKRRT